MEDSYGEGLAIHTGLACGNQTSAWINDCEIQLRLSVERTKPLER
jgi:hypothetical protein